MASAPGDWAWMAVVAGEELAKLEAAHPGLFGPLKAELKRLIAEPGWDGADAFPLPSPDAGGAPARPSSSSSSQCAAPADLIVTQESSTRKRKWGGGGGGGGAVGQEQGKRRRKGAAAGVKDRADMAIERANKCLKRLRAIKRSLLGFTD